MKGEPPAGIDAAGTACRDPTTAKAKSTTPAFQAGVRFEAKF